MYCTCRYIAPKLHDLRELLLFIVTIASSMLPTPYILFGALYEAHYLSHDSSLDQQNSLYRKADQLRM